MNVRFNVSEPNNKHIYSTRTFYIMWTKNNILINKPPAKLYDCLFVLLTMLIPESNHSYDIGPNPNEGATGLILLFVHDFFPFHILSVPLSIVVRRYSYRSA